MVNKVILVGNLGADPELRSTNSQQSVCSLRLATSETYKDKDGQKQERTEWHQIVVWGQQAEVVNRYCRKGKQIYVEGRLQTRKWQDKNGQDRYTTEIVADTIRFLGTKEGAAEGAGEGERAGESRSYGNRSSGGSDRSSGGGYGSRSGGGGGSDRRPSAPPMDEAPYGSDDDIPF
jgi:single-strand DNA-binding protein